MIAAWILLLFGTNSTDTTRRYYGTGAGTATSLGIGEAQARRFHPVAVYDVTVNQQQTEYVNLDRKGT